MLSAAFTLLFYGIVILGPPAVVVWFVVSLVRFIRGDKGEFEDYRKRKSHLIVSSILLVTVAVPICVFIIMFEMAIRNM